MRDRRFRWGAAAGRWRPTEARRRWRTARPATSATQFEIDGDLPSPALSPETAAAVALEGLERGRRAKRTRQGRIQGAVASRRTHELARAVHDPLLRPQARVR